MRLASLKADNDGAVLILIDAGDDCPGKLGPELLARAVAIHPPDRTAVVLAKKEFEAWYLAGAESLAGHRGIAADFTAPEDSESIRGAKGRLSAAMEGARLSISRRWLPS